MEVPKLRNSDEYAEAKSRANSEEYTKTNSGGCSKVNSDGNAEKS